MHLTPLTLISYQNKKYDFLTNIYKPCVNYNTGLSNDTFVKNSANTNTTVSFNGKPIRLVYEHIAPMSAEEAISIYENLKHGKYLNITHHNWFGNDEPSYKDIRERNLAFLNYIEDENEKAKFVDYFKKLTFFPDLEKVSDNIINEFVKSAHEASKSVKISCVNPQYGNIIRAGYNNTCSVGKGKAFPGSDMDGAYIILNGCGDLESDEDIVNRFKGYLWDYTDQRILSYNHESAFPQVYTLTQIKHALYNANHITDRMHLHEKLGFLDFFTNQSNARTQFGRYNEHIGLYSDSISANEFFINLCSNLPNRQPVSYNDMTVEQMKNFGFLLETLREGTHLTNYEFNNKPIFYENFMDEIKESDIYKLVNLGQLAAYKNNVSTKTKIKSRTNLPTEFPKWSIPRQYDFIKEVIKASCSQNSPYRFSDYFNSGGDPYSDLLHKLGMH